MEKTFVAVQIAFISDGEVDELEDDILGNIVGKIDSTPVDSSGKRHHRRMIVFHRIEAGEATLLV